MSLTKPIAVFQFSARVAPGYFALYCQKMAQDFVVIRIDQGAMLPESPEVFSGVCLLGGEMSVNDPLPWIEPLCTWLRWADALGRPIIGHCLGGQLISKAFGAEVRRHRVKEIGWGTIQVQQHPVAQEWLGARQSFETFQWHGDTFDLPPGAVPLMQSAYCQHQGYVLHERHLAMQCHVEMTSELVRDWCVAGQEEISQEKAATGGPATQWPEQILDGLDEKTQALHTIAEQLYARWMKQLV